MRLQNIFAMFARALSFANISRPDSVFKCLWYNYRIFHIVYILFAKIVAAIISSVNHKINLSQIKIGLQYI